LLVSIVAGDGENDGW